MLGRDAGDPLFLEAREAPNSVLEPSQTAVVKTFGDVDVDIDGNRRAARDGTTTAAAAS